MALQKLNSQEVFGWKGLESDGWKAPHPQQKAQMGSRLDSLGHKVYTVFTGTSSAKSNRVKPQQIQQ